MVKKELSTYELDSGWHDGYKKWIPEMGLILRLSSKKLVDVIEIADGARGDGGIEDAVTAGVITL